jgi:hypothetical protein
MSNRAVVRKHCPSGYLFGREARVKQSDEKGCEFGRSSKNGPTLQESPHVHMGRDSD